MEKVLTTDVKKEKDCLYFVKANEEGYLEVYKTKMIHKGRPKKSK